ncbi:MAG: tetratricopeptide repeat protein [Candidatus Omnitrophota bacterium]
MKFSLGYNHDIGMVALLERYRAHIEALYFPAPGRLIGSGRHLDQDNRYETQIPELIAACQKLDIRSQLLLNATCEGRDGLAKNFFSPLVTYVKDLRDRGLTTIVVTNPLYIEQFKKCIPGLVVEASVNCYMRTPEHAVYLKNLGADILTIDRDINRDISLIRKIKEATGLPLRLMLNEGCVRNCPFRNLHYNYIAHGGIPPHEALRGICLDKFCMKIYRKNPEKIFAIPFVLPEDVRRYKGLVDFYKLTTRIFSTKQLEACLKAYISGTFTGNLLTIIDSPGLAAFEYVDSAYLVKKKFFKRMLSCDGVCRRCGYCARLLSRAAVLNREYLPETVRASQALQAIQVYRRARKSQGFDSALQINVGRASMDAGLYKKAIRAFKNVIVRNPGEAEAYLLLSSCYEKSAQIKEAFRVYHEALKRLPQARPLYVGLARLYFAMRDYDAVIKNIQRALDIPGQEHIPRLYFMLGISYQKTRCYKKALRFFNKLQKYPPVDPEVYAHLSQCYRALGEVRRAKDTLARGSALRDNNETSALTRHAA